MLGPVARALAGAVRQEEAEMDMKEVLAVGVSEAARRLGISTRTVTNLVKNKQIVSRKIGRRRLIPVLALERFLRRDHEVPGSAARQIDIGKR